MKWSIYIIVLLCAISLLLTSCNNSTIESTPNIFSDSKDIAMETTNCSASDIIVETEKTLNSSFETETTLLESSFKENSEPVENTNQSYTTYETIPDQFESLMKVKSKNGEDGVCRYHAIRFPRVLHDSFSRSWCRSFIRRQIGNHVLCTVNRCLWS